MNQALYAHMNNKRKMKKKIKNKGKREYDLPAERQSSLGWSASSFYKLSPYMLPSTSKTLYPLLPGRRSHLCHGKLRSSVQPLLWREGVPTMPPGSLPEPFQSNDSCSGHHSSHTACTGKPSLSTFTWIALWLYAQTCDFLVFYF
jgi:hypothetical protein